MGYWTQGICMHKLQAAIALEQNGQKIKSVRAPGGTDEALAPYQLMVAEGRNSHVEDSH